MKNSDKLLQDFLEKAKALNIEVIPIKILRTNTFSLGNSHVLVRTASDLGKRYFFGLNYINAEEIYNLDNSFIAFICGSIDKTVFLPAEVLVKHLPQLSHDRNGEYKINFTRDLNLVLRGRGNHLDCSQYANNWDLILNPPKSKLSPSNPDESFHAVIQGRLLEIGNIRGYRTYCPDKSKSFNKTRLDDLATLKICPNLQYSDLDLLRKIDVIWFREARNSYYPEYAFEVELSTGVWSGFGRLATLREYSTRLYIITHDNKKFAQVSNSFQELRSKYYLIVPDNIGLLYAAEINLIKMRRDFNL